MKNTVKIL